MSVASARRARAAARARRRSACAERSGGRRTAARVALRETKGVHGICKFLGRQRAPPKTPLARHRARAPLPSEQVFLPWPLPTVAAAPQAARERATPASLALALALALALTLALALALRLRQKQLGNASANKPSVCSAA